MAEDNFYPRSAQGTALTGWTKSPSSQSPFDGEAIGMPVKGEIYSISVGGISAAEIDVTALTDATKRFILGTRDGGTVTVQAFMVSNIAPGLPVTGNSTPSNYRLCFPRKPMNAADPNADYAVIVLFSAYIQSTVFEAAVDDAVRVTYTLRVSGPVLADWRLATEVLEPI